jgi:hypothetical protein
MSIACVYDATIRNNGTAVLIWHALKHELGFGDELVRYEPHGELPKHDLYIYIDDGRDDINWECPKPNAYYAIDTHLGYEYRANKAKGYDRVFCAQKGGAAKMRAEGINAEWLPLACSPGAHPNYEELMVHPERENLWMRHGINKLYDVVFVGFMNRGDGTPQGNDRTDYLDYLCKEIPNFWISTNCFFEDMAVRYLRGRLGFNISIRNDLNMRFFEIPSIGTCMLANRTVDGYEDLGFKEGEHFLGFEGKEEMVEKARWGLDNPVEREQMARAAHVLVRENHTYAHRVQVILDAFGIKKEASP